MDVVVHYSPPVGLEPPFARSLPGSVDGRRLSLPSSSHRSSQPSSSKGQDATPTNTGSSLTAIAQGEAPQAAVRGAQNAQPSATFNRAVEISLMEPVGSMSLSPANRDVVLAARKGLFILDLENPYDQPRFLPHLTTWVPADVQWNPHPARANWVASTSNNKLLVWNLDRPSAHNTDPIISVPVRSGATTDSSANSAIHFGNTPSTGLTGTLPHVPGLFDNSGPTVSRSSSISHILNAHTRAITDINWSPFHPEILASCGIDSWMWAWDLREPSRPKQGYSAWNAAMTQVKWNRASPHRLATSCDNKVLIWDDRKGALPLASIEAAHSRIYGIDWSRDTSLGLSRLVTCSLDGSVKWWDLDSPAAQQAIGERRLVTEAETTIETRTPVWRARHLPFGTGVMTLPQRGDTSLGMWAKDKPDEPVHRFEGHRDIVKEYLIRTQGGSDRERDDRKFQLITWSKDQTLRLWPITEDMMESVGHKRDTPIRVLQTRIGAENVSYRVAPVVSPEASNIPLISSPDGIIKSLPSSAGASILPPSDAIQTVLSGNRRTSLSSADKMSGKASGSVGSPVATLSPIDAKQQGWSASYGSEGPTSGSFGDKRLQNTLGLNFSTRRRSAVTISGVDGKGGYGGRSSAGRMSLGAPKAFVAGSSFEQARKEDDRKHEKRKKKHKEIHSKQMATQNFMTRGTGSRAGHGRFGAYAGKGTTGRGAALDAVGWIAGVRMGDEERRSPRKEKDPSKQGADDTEKGNQAGDDIPLKDATQVLGEEIKSVSRNVSGATFEKIDVSTRVCTVTCYGPWAGKRVACFLRVTFTFPPSYPHKVPRFELEHNASVSLKTRAFLLRKLGSILKEWAERAEPSMQECLVFLQKGTREDRLAYDPPTQGFWLPSDESDEEEEAKITMRMPPPRCGASFGPGGALVTFRPSTKMVELHTQRPSVALAAELESIGTDQYQVGGPPVAGTRFLQSYTALSGAMTSLARLAKEGTAVKHLDVVQLMADQNFFAKRIHQQQKSLNSSRGGGGGGDSAVRSSSRRGHSRGISQTVQDRLEYIKSTDSSSSRPSSSSRSGRRTRSASPGMKARDLPMHSLPLDRRSGGPEADQLLTEAKSVVRIWNVAKLVPHLMPPAMMRKRSSSMPSSPAPLTPRAESSFMLASLDVPQTSSTQQRRSAARATFDEEEDEESASDESHSSASDEEPTGERSDDDEEPDAAAVLEQTQRDGMHPVVEQVFDTIIWTIPFAFLFLMMDIMIQQQYATQPTFWREVVRMANTMPVLTSFVYCTAIHSDTKKHRVLLQLLMFLVSTVCGSAFLYVYARSSMDMVLQRVPPLGTLWMYSLVRLDLPGVLLSLALIYLFTLQYNLPILA